MARVTLKTIAEHVGVSRMTVSNAFSRPDQLSEDLRARILIAAEELGYAGPDPAARALARGRTGVIGMVLTNSARDAFTDDVAVGFVRAVAGSLADAGYSLVLLHSSGDDGVVPARDIAMDGAIVYSCDPATSAFTALRERRLPIVNVEGSPHPGVPDVALDNTTGARQAAQHLVDLGHTRIAIVLAALDADDALASTIPLETPSTTIAGRMAGWMAPLERAGIDPILIGTPGLAIDDLLTERIERMLDDPPTAVLAFSDLAALEVMERAKARGLRVPEQISIIGFDDNPIASRVSPPLTTVRQDIDAKGEAAAATLLGLLRGEDAISPHPLPTELVVRASTAPADDRPARP
ncbi:LacI family transcriptional regulator [Microbacterium sp. M28]|uniref:LacI family DNA-binding transcriptional regulator n=1 Tax=Microbacterium sp. M28 TaxID=2962064 RepID=UPI0021F4D6B2|nr:LacI family DNA-binding transcriptional regulator [Microbacterium sp. M28]UYO96527.1 LacI family transcriptional regulator [Microbacterium sp. M28]